MGMVRPKLIVPDSLAELPRGSAQDDRVRHKPTSRTTTRRRNENPTPAGGRRPALALGADCCILALWHELVADPRFGHQMLGMGRIALQLAAEAPHEHAQVLGLVAVLRAPHPLKERAVGQYFAGVGH